MSIPLHGPAAWCALRGGELLLCTEAGRSGGYRDDRRRGSARQARDELRLESGTVLAPRRETRFRDTAERLDVDAFRAVSCGELVPGRARTGLPRGANQPSAETVYRALRQRACTGTGTGPLWSSSRIGAAVRFRLLVEEERPRSSSGTGRDREFERKPR
ncbi:hypothetical protein [Streptomyces sp. SID3343]|uniref:hypothetical protein n=1 Tax=Streptomyces sp. SID3343 TaxID=2690260 RepID=UPI0013686CC0|nr:hypothetical protein [Streptomyces sp. SID3343]MYW06066.1 hypothetical protein [Streptomyces sp. SID3343]